MGAEIWTKQWLLRRECSIQGGGEAVDLFDWDQHEQSIRQRRGMTIMECGISSVVRSGVACLGAILWR